MALPVFVMMLLAEGAIVNDRAAVLALDVSMLRGKGLGSGTKMIRIRPISDSLELMQWDSAGLGVAWLVAVSE